MKVDFLVAYLNMEWAAFSNLSPQLITLIYKVTYQNRLPGILDFFIINSPNHINQNISNLDDFSFDHTPILLFLNGQNIFNTTYLAFNS